MVPSGWVHGAEHLQRSAFRCRGESKERQIRLRTAPSAGLASQRLLHRIDRRREQPRVLRLRDRQLLLQSGTQRDPQILRGLAALRRMRLIDHHRVAPRRNPSDLVEHKGELLQGRDDDPGLLAGQRVGELLGALVDLHDHATGMLKLVDRVLQLPVQDDPVGDHHDLVEHLVVPSVVQGREAVRGPRDRVRLP